MSAQDLPNIDVLRERQLLPVECLAVVLVGSSARGWSHAKSDYDLYVVGDEERPEPYHSFYRIPTQPTEVYSEAFHANGRRWEATYWQSSQIEQIIAKVGWPEFEDSGPGQLLVGREEVMLERLSTGIPIHGRDWLRDRVAEIEASAHRTMIITRSLADADDAVEDVVGLLESGNTHSAVLAARRALGHSVDALLEEHGQFGSAAQKWRPLRFRAADPAVLSFETYWALETMQGFDPQRPEEWISHVLRVCREIAMKVEL